MDLPISSLKYERSLGQKKVLVQLTFQVVFYKWTCRVFSCAIKSTSLNVEEKLLKGVFLLQQDLIWDYTEAWSLFLVPGTALKQVVSPWYFVMPFPLSVTNAFLSKLFPLSFLPGRETEAYCYFVFFSEPEVGGMLHCPWKSATHICCLRCLASPCFMEGIDLCGRKIELYLQMSTKWTQSFCSATRCVIGEGDGSGVRARLSRSSSMKLLTAGYTTLGNRNVNIL